MPTRHARRHARPCATSVEPYTMIDATVSSVMSGLDPVDSLSP
jgi:hypothetical protein